MPLPGEDLELRDLLLSALRPHLSTEPPEEDLAQLVVNIRRYVMQENKRRNMVGEGLRMSLRPSSEEPSKGLA